jgi:hypothetical protein
VAVVAPFQVLNQALLQWLASGLLRGELLKQLQENENGIFGFIKIVFSL